MTIDVYDVFAGCGGSSAGFRQAGLRPVFALDNDKSAVATYRRNFPDVKVAETDIRTFAMDSLAGQVKRSPATLFCGCAPCQPFTRQNTRQQDAADDDRRGLLAYFGEAVATHRPDYVFVENVPGMQQIKGNSTLARFRRRLEGLGYHVVPQIVASQSYGVPQRRRRLILLASKRGKIKFPKPTHGTANGEPLSCVRDRIGHFPPIAAGECHPEVPNHRAAALSPLNLRRIKKTPVGGSRAGWPDSLQLRCHAKARYGGHSDVYGRMWWDRPATGLTTRCISLSNGRFGHPEQHRAISVREAAALQTFPDDFEFSGTLHSQAAQIGNAVPVLLAEVFGKHILRHHEKHG